MPTVKDKTTGDVVSQQPYTSKGTQRAKQIADTDPNWELSYAPNGKTDGATRSQQSYAGGGKTGYNQIGAQPMYKKGGEVKKTDAERKAAAERRKTATDEYIKSRYPNVYGTKTNPYPAPGTMKEIKNPETGETKKVPWHSGVKVNWDEYHKKHPKSKKK